MCCQSASNSSAAIIGSEVYMPVPISDFPRITVIMSSVPIRKKAFGWKTSVLETVSRTEVFQPNAFLRIGTDDMITVILGKSEMGTGIYTSLPMIAAEELDADWQHIRVEAAPVDEVYFHPTFHIQMTGGSSSVTSEWERLRKAGATARAMLIAAAAKNWDVD